MRIVNETALTFDEVTEMLEQKENSDNQSDYQSSPLKVFGGPNATKGELFWGGNVFGVLLSF